jgi:arsenate reductase
MLFVQYPKCSTCKKAKKWLEDKEISYEDRHIVENNPKKEELKSWYEKSGYPLKKFFNTSGNAYKEAVMKDKIPHMTEDEMLEVLSSNGMMVKRPILVGKDFVLIGFNEKEWEEKINKYNILKN